MDKEIENVGIVKELEKRSEEASDVKILIGKVNEIVRDASVLLGRVSDTFVEYTLHEKTHSLNVLKIMDRIVPKETLEQMNELELAILILSAFLHDIGMVVVRQKKKEILQSEDFSDFKEKYPRINHSLKKAQEEGNYRIATQIEDQILTYYLRETHAARGAKFIKTKFGDKLKYRDLDFSDLVCKVCQSHGEPWEKLGVRGERLHGYPLREEYPTSHSIGNLEVNVQYLAIVLRIADILDFDRERTPSILFEYLYPISEISLKHWLAHLSVQGWLIGEDKIKYRVECEHPLYQKTVNDFLDKIDAELQGAKLLIEKFPGNITERYKMHLPRAVDRSEVGPKIVKGKPSYIYGDFQFGLDYDRVIALLGEELHYDETVAIRELLQNSVDACKNRLALEKTLGTNWDRKKANIHFIYDSTAQTITVEDNGIGMDREIVQNHFLRIGCSYYSEDNSRYLRDIAMFKDKGVTFYPISKFGIGILSCFMLADKIEVKTRRKEYDHLGSPLSIQISPELKMYVMKELEPSDWSNGKDSGTIVTLHLTRSIDLRKALEQFAINLEFDVSVTIDGITTKIKPRGFGLKCFPEVRKRVSDHLKEKRLISFAIDFSKSKIEGIRGKTTLFFPCVRGKLLVPREDEINLESIGLESEIVGGEYRPHGLDKTLATSQGIYVPRGVEISLPFPHITVIDFFSESRPQLTLDRRSFKGGVKSIQENLYDFISKEIRRGICNGRLHFHSPFWKFLWDVNSDLQELFFMDRKAKNELFELPLLVKGKRMSLSYQKIREHFQTGICIVFRRHESQIEPSFTDYLKNYSISPPDLPLLAVVPEYRGSSNVSFWMRLFDWSELTLVEKKNYYYLKIQLKDQVNPINKKMYEKIQLRYYYPRFAKYDGIPSDILYSNNFAFALNVKHQLVRLFLSCLEKASSEKELALTRTFAGFLRDISFGKADLHTGVPLGGKLKKQRLISSSATGLFKVDSLHVRDINEMKHLFLEPPPLAYRYGLSG